MSEQLLPQQIRLSLNDASGTPLPGGSVTFFETGTTDLADIWADAAASVPLANPVVADAAGRIVQVFFTAGYGVKAVIKTAAGVTVDTLDPCPRFSGTASAASAISFAPITGNAATNVQTAIANNTAEATVAREIVNGGTGATSAAGARTNLGAAAIDSPALTGTPTAPTAAAGTNTTQLATTAFARGEINTANVSAATAGVAAGAVGTYCFAAEQSVSTAIELGDTVAGSSLNAAGMRSNGDVVGDGSGSRNGVGLAATTLTGTWRCMGYVPVTSGSVTISVTLFLRIS